MIASGKPGDTIDVDPDTISIASPLPSPSTLSNFSRRGSEVMQPVKDTLQERKELLRKLSVQLSIGMITMRAQFYREN